MRLHEIKSLYTQVQAALKQSAKIPNTKVISLGDHRPYKIVDINDPRPAVKYDPSILDKIAVADQLVQNAKMQLDAWEQQQQKANYEKHKHTGWIPALDLKNTSRYQQLSAALELARQRLRELRRAPRHVSADKQLSETYIPKYYSQPVDQIQTAIARMNKMPNSKIVLVGQYGGFRVVDRSDPRPEVLPDFSLLRQIRSTRQRITAIDHLLRKYKWEYGVYYHPQEHPEKVKKMLANTPVLPLEKEKSELKKTLDSFRDLPRYTLAKK